jgi:hypothetical protein
MCELDIDFRSLRVGKVAYPLERRDLRVCLDTASSCEMRPSDTTVGAYTVILPVACVAKPDQPDYHTTLHLVRKGYVRRCAKRRSVALFLPRCTVLTHRGLEDSAPRDHLFHDRLAVSLYIHKQTSQETSCKNEDRLIRVEAKCKNGGLWEMNKCRVFRNGSTNCTALVRKWVEPPPHLWVWKPTVLTCGKFVLVCSTVPMDRLQKT